MVSTLRTPCQADQLLIEEVRQHEVLYACPTKSNKDNQLRDAAWTEIADNLGKSVDEAKERWRYMRDKYVKDLGRSDKHRASNEQPPDANSFIGLMSFLNPFIKRKSSGGSNNRASSGNENHFEMCLNPHDMEGDFPSDDDRQNGSDGGGNIEFVSSVSDDGHPISMPQHMSNGNRAIVAIKREHRAAMRRQQHQQQEICAVPVPCDVIDTGMSPSNCHQQPKRQRMTMMQQQEDSTSLFCASVAGMLAELQPYQRERIKRDIYNLVSDALLNELSN